MEHFAEMGSGSLSIIKGDSSRNVILIWNLSGTPCGGTWLFPGHTISLISSPFQVFHIPIYKEFKLWYYFWIEAENFFPLLYIIVPLKNYNVKDDLQFLPPPNIVLCMSVCFPATTTYSLKVLSSSPLARCPLETRLH